MNELGMRLLWLAGQATLLGLAAAGLYMVVAWRRPGAGAHTALAGLAGMIALTVLTLLPLPAWWAWETVAAALMGTSEEVMEPGQALLPVAPLTGALTSDSDDLPGPSKGFLTGLFALWQQYRPTQVAKPGEPENVWAILAAFFVGGVAVGLLRLLFGLWAVYGCGLRSVAIEDSSLTGLLKSLLDQMKCRRVIAVRESTEMGGAVTVGWRRPLLLLPPAWRIWSDQERRAVLAHELAHIRRGDYFAGLLAQIGIALHFYHPLVHWLANRLHLQQELAADALGARFAGGRAAYLRALASLALQQDEQVPRPVRAFLPARGTLKRRIAMLRTEEKSQTRAGGRIVPLALLGLVAVVVSALRGPAQEPVGPPPSKAEASHKDNEPRSKAMSDRPPFVYCYCPPGASGIYAFRPSVCFGDPSMKKYAVLFNKEVGAFIGPPGTFPAIEDIEQISGGIFFQYEASAPEGQRRRMVDSIGMVRTVHGRDWKKLIDAIAPKQTEIRIEGHTCIKVQIEDLKQLGLLLALSGAGTVHQVESDPGTEKSICFVLPDERTLLLGSETQFREILAKGPDTLPEWAIAAGWQTVEHAVFAAAINNRDQRFAHVYVAPNEEWTKIPSLKALMDKTASLVFGVDHDDELKFNAYASCANENDANAVANAALELLKLGITATSRPTEKTQDSTAESAVWLKALLQQAAVSLEGASEAEPKPNVAHVRAQVKAKWVDLFDHLGTAKVAAEEVESRDK